MKLYYFCDIDGAQCILRDRRLKVSRINRLNDPFELLGVSLGVPKVRMVVKYVKEKVSDRFGVICMSQSYQSPVMWAHYGKNHTGLCFCFEVNDAVVSKVTYAPDRLKSLLDESSSLKNVTEEHVRILLTTKSSEWSYEKESRFVFKLDGAIKDGDHYYVPFDSSVFMLKEIIIGAYCEYSVDDVAGFLKKSSARVGVWQVRPAFSDFKMVRDKKVDQVIVMPNV